MNKTEKEFWEKFWGELKLPQTVTMGFKNDRVIARALLDHLPNGGGRLAAEIGCAPGKWLVFLNKELGYSVEGYEYVPAAADAARRNLALCGVPGSENAVRATDFFAVNTPDRYDLVLSLGFIEHFDDFSGTFGRHLDLVKPGGYLAIGVPRFKGLSWFFAALVDIWREPRILPAHNLAVMEPGVFSSEANRRGLITEFCGYVGGFEPALFDAAAVRPAPLRWVLRLALKGFGLLFGKLDSAFTSSYVMTIFKKAG